MKKSVSESIKLTKSQKMQAQKTVIDIAEKEIKDVFKKCILGKCLSQSLIQAIIEKLGTDNFNYAGKGMTFKSHNSPFMYNDSIDNIMKILDIILYNKHNHFMDYKNYDGYPICNNWYRPNGQDTIRDLAELIEYLVKLLKNEYYIEDNRIYSTHNQKLIRGIKELNDDKLNHILSNLSVSGDLKQGIKELYDFCYKKKKLINEKLPKHKVTAKDNNGKKIDNATIETWHFFSNFLNVETKIRDLHDDTGREPTREELLVFFDFGLSLARLIKIWENKI